jgi:hypothetical protein
MAYGAQPRCASAYLVGLLLGTVDKRCEGSRELGYWVGAEWSRSERDGIVM